MYPTEPDVPLPADCRRCGVCCFSESPTYVRVTGDDWTRLGAGADAVAHFLGNRAYMRMHDGHCAALEIRPAATNSGVADFFCTIYERRPQTCRDLGRGSAHCLGELAMKGGEASTTGQPAIGTRPLRETTTDTTH